jgi:hypothetical protein
MVRDDFWMACDRLMDTLDIRLIKAENFMTVDLFEDEHTRHVLCKFGQAYGKIPEDLDETSRSANLFEWVDDWYAKGMDRVACGGSWDGDAASCRTAHSNLTTPTIRSANLGFRLALSSSGIPKSPEADK